MVQNNYVILAVFYDLGTDHFEVNS